MFKKKPSPSFEEVSLDIEKWLTSENPDKETIALKTLLSIVSTRYLDTKDSINYLKANLNNADYEKRIAQIDENMKVTHSIYQLIFEQLVK